MLNRFSLRIPNISLQRLFARTSSLNFTTSRALKATKGTKESQKEQSEGNDTGLSITELDDGSLNLPDSASVRKIGQDLFPDPPEEIQKLKITLSADEGRDMTLALFADAARKQDLTGAANELNQFYQKNAENEELEFLLSRVDVEDSAKLKTIQEKELDWSGVISGGKQTTYLGSLIANLQKENRLGELFTIIESFNKLMEDWKGESAVVITTPTPLSPASLKFFQTSIAAQFSDQSIKNVVNAVDESLGLGYVVQIGETYRMDMSWRARREQMIANLPSESHKRKGNTKEKSFDPVGEFKTAMPKEISADWVEDLLKGVK